MECEGLLIAHSQYLAPVSFYASLYASQGLLIDDTTPFVKQTYRNRAVIATENGAQTLTVPVVHGGRQTMRDVRISEHGNWRHLHWNALATAYRKSPFFDYYADDFARFYEERDGFLLDFNMRLHSVVCELLGLDVTVRLLSEFGGDDLPCNTTDVRPFVEPSVVAPCSVQPYYQVFALRNGFQPDMSIVDLLFNMGPEGLLVLRDARFA